MPDLTKLAAKELENLLVLGLNQLTKAKWGEKPPHGTAGYLNALHNRSLTAIRELTAAYPGKDEMLEMLGTVLPDARTSKK